MSRRENSNRSYDDQQQQQHQPPDHGENFVPGAEDAPNLAPQPLDHFKRGYQERANQRKRETSNHDSGSGSGNGGGTYNNNNNNESIDKHPPRDNKNKNNDPRGSYQDIRPEKEDGGGKGGGERGGPRISCDNGNGNGTTGRLNGSHYGSGGGGGGGGRGSGRGDSDRNRRYSGGGPYHGAGRGRGGRNGTGGRGRGRGRDSDRYHRDSCRGGSSGRGGDRRSSFSSGDRGGAGRGGGQQIIMGLDIQALVDRLVRPGCDVFRELDNTREGHMAVFQSGKAVTAIISNLARRRNLRIANGVWDWIDYIGIEKNTFHYNSMISVCEKARDYNKALRLLDEMKEKKVSKNEVTFSSAISACEKCGQWRMALDLLDQMKKEGAGQTAIAYNAAISACEKGLVPHKALEVFEQMKREGVRPTVVTYSALISAAEKGQQWKLALEVLEEMKAAGHGANVIAYSAAISALSKGQMWHKALELFREIEISGGKPSIVTYNATMTALEKGLQWERALDLFDEMKLKNLPITVVSYGSAISACEKGLQYRQCLEYLDEMTEMGIRKNVIIFGAAMSCMEKSCRADIGFQLMDRMKLEDVAPNVHIYNSAISACARCNLWEKGYGLFEEMDEVRVARDVVTYNAVLDAVCSEVELGRKLFKEGVEKGFYARVSRLGTQWLELDLHFLSLGGGEIALGWWFEECLVPYLINTSKLEAVQSISIVTGYGKTRSRGARMNDDGMRLRVRAMLKYMDIHESPQPNKGRIHIDKSALIGVVKKNNGRILFDLEGYTRFKEEETTANKFPDVVQQVRPRFRPARPGQGPPGTFIRDGDSVPPYNPSDEKRRDSTMEPSMRRHGYNDSSDHQENRRFSSYRHSREDRMPERVSNSERSSGDDRIHDRGTNSYSDRTSESRNQDHRYGDDWRGGPRDNQRRSGYSDHEGHSSNRVYRGDCRVSKMEYIDRRSGIDNDSDRRGERQPEFDERRGNDRNWNGRNSIRSIRDYDAGTRGEGEVDHRRGDDRDGRSSMSRLDRSSSSYYSDDRRISTIDSKSSDHISRGPINRDMRFSDRNQDRGSRVTPNNGREGTSSNAYEKREISEYRGVGRQGHDMSENFRSVRNDPEVQVSYKEEEESLGSASKKRSYDDYQKQQPPSRGYDIEPAYAKRRSSS